MKYFSTIFAIFFLSLSAYASNVTSTSSPTATINVEATNAVGVRPDLAGVRVTGLNGGAVYLVNPEGVLQWIPNPATYNNLFRDWNNIRYVDTAQYVIGANLTDGAILIRGANTGAVYLLSNGVKRWVVSPAAMDKYNFNWNNIVVLPQIVVDSLPTGSNYQ